MGRSGSHIIIIKALKDVLLSLLPHLYVQLIYVPLKTALIVSLVSCIIESLPVKYDNITIPLGTGLFLGLLV